MQIDRLERTLEINQDLSHKEQPAADLHEDCAILVIVQPYPNDGLTGSYSSLSSCLRFASCRKEGCGTTLDKSNIRSLEV